MVHEGHNTGAGDHASGRPASATRPAFTTLQGVVNAVHKEAFIQFVYGQGSVLSLKTYCVNL